MINIEDNILVEPFVGMPATIGIGSDTYPATVIEVKTPRKIILQYDAVVHRSENNFQSEEQKYTYFPDPFGEKVTFTLRKDLKWKKVGSYYHYLVLGKRIKYRDPCF